MTNPLPHFAPLIDRLRYAPETVKPEEIEDMHLLLLGFVSLIDDHSAGAISTIELVKQLRELRDEIEG